MVVDQSPTLGGARLERYYHACGFFQSRDEAYRVLAPFIKEGLEWGEKALHITNPELQPDDVARLNRAGVDVERYREANRLEIINWDEAYLQGGRFDPEAMLSLLEDVIRKNRDEGYHRTRIVGDMGWALEDKPGVDQVMVYEARVNAVLAKHREPALCAYDITKIDAETMLNVLRTHPMVIISGTLSENPFFMPPDEFLAQMNERNSSGQNRVHT